MLAHVVGLSVPLPLWETLENEADDMCEFLHTPNHHYFNGGNKGRLSYGRHRPAKSLRLGRGFSCAGPRFSLPSAVVATSREGQR
jgi:hypothetical protein